uniref:protein PIN-LIKES 7-like isoform X2 n=1 Tax=Erigeron canadensis TaxID=72917 RepID=UPI001CB8BEE0|nr:protein PIN-LIKES 7-like isoform X2 [Erigeron canadensis]
MGFWGLLEVASMPILQVLIVSAVGAFMATDYLNLLSNETRNSLNKIVFVVFTPSLIFTSLVETVTLEDIISWWFMPINIGITFLFGGILGWIAVKLIKPKPHLEGLIIAMCSTGNYANLLVIMVPAMCTDDGSLFGDHSVCKAKGLSYASFSMAIVGRGLSGNEDKKTVSFSNQLADMIKKIVEQLLSPPTLGSFAGLVFGAIPWVKALLVGEKAPLRALQDSLTLLGDGTVPCLTLILGGNLIQGLQKASVGPTIIITVIIVRYLILPIIGIGVINLAATLGLLPVDPLFRFVMLIMFALPPGVNISTMAQFFSVGQEECAMLMMWTYLVAAFALTAWSTIYMWILS